MDPSSTRSILVRLGIGLCLLGIVGGGLTVAARVASGQPFDDMVLILSGVAVVAGLVLVALAMLRVVAERGNRSELYHGPESSTLSFAPPSIGSFPTRQRPPKLRRPR